MASSRGILLTNDYLYLYRVGDVSRALMSGKMQLINMSSTLSLITRSRVRKYREQNMSGKPCVQSMHIVILP